jgi:hypothetical protein
VRDHLEELGPAVVAVIAFADQAELAGHRDHLGLPFPLLADPDRSLYHRFGLQRGSLRDVYSPGTLRLYWRLLRAGRRLRRPVDDTRQLGGDFVLDRAGVLAAGFWPASPDDRPDVQQLIDAVRQAT